MCPLFNRSAFCNYLIPISLFRIQSIMSMQQQWLQKHTKKENRHRKHDHTLCCWNTFIFDYGVLFLWHCFSKCLQCHKMYVHLMLHSFSSKPCINDGRVWLVPKAFSSISLFDQSSQYVHLDHICPIVKKAVKQHLSVCNLGSFNAGSWSGLGISIAYMGLPVQVILKQWYTVVQQYRKQNDKISFQPFCKPAP